IDAALLAGFGRAIAPDPTPAPDPTVERLSELESQRRHTMHLLLAAQNRLAQLGDKQLVRGQKRLIAAIQKQIEQIESLLEEPDRKFPRPPHQSRRSPELRRGGQTHCRSAARAHARTR